MGARSRDQGTKHLPPLFLRLWYRQYWEALKLGPLNAHAGRGIEPNVGS